MAISPAKDSLTVIIGENGSGKTSLLEAIGYASRLESFRDSPREALVRNGCDRAYVHADIATDDRSVSVNVELTPSGRDVVLVNHKRPTKGAELLDVFRVTIFTPDDLALVKDGPQERRNFLDELLAASDPRLRALRQGVEKTLRQRGALLRQAGGRLTAEIATTLDVWDSQLGESGAQLVDAREELVRAIAPVANRAFQALTGLEGLRLTYQRSFVGALAEALERARSQDVARGMTTVGPHRDDLAIYIQDLDVRTRVSQGRQRAVALSLRLAAHEIVGTRTQSRPILLLDDAFSELDEDVSRALANELPVGQAILTTATPPPSNTDVACVLKLHAGVVR